MPLRIFGRCLPLPILSSLENSNDFGQTPCATKLEVYIGTRLFRECGGPIGRRLPIQFKEFARTCGACHYLVVFRSPDGSMVRFDFGPTGGDVFGNPFGIRLPRLGSKTNANCVPGEIRETQITELPADCVYVGTTDLRLEDIYRFNSEQSVDYELHKNDCRHYVNKLTEYATGIEGIASYCVRTRFNLIKDEIPLWSLCMIRIFQVMSDVSQWQRVKAAGNATAAVVLALVGPSFARRVNAVAHFAIRPSIAVHVTPEKIVARPARRAAVAAVATVAATWEERPIVKSLIDIGGTFNEHTRSFLMAASSVFSSVRRNVVSFRVGPARIIAARSAAQPFPLYGLAVVRRMSGRSLSFLSTSLFRPFVSPHLDRRCIQYPSGPRRPLGSRGRRHQISVPMSI